MVLLAEKYLISVIALAVLAQLISSAHFLTIKTFAYFLRVRCESLPASSCQTAFVTISQQI